MSGRPRADINVTPLVDVCLVLLIIFMVVTPMIVDRVELPKTLSPDEAKPDRTKQIKLVVGYPQPTLWLEDQPIEGALLLERLREAKARNPEKQLVLLADARLDVSDVRRAMKISDEAGFHSFGLVVQRAPGP